MAVHAPITGAPSRAPSINRRSIIGALGLAAPVAALAAQQGAAQPAHSGIVTSPFAAALAKHDAALAAEEAFDLAYCGPANLAARRAEDGIPHVSVEVAGAMRTTRRWEDFIHCDGLSLALAPTHGQEPSEACLAARRLVAAARERRDAIATLPEVRRAEALTDRSDALLDERLRWRDRALEAPVANVAELARKFALIAHYADEADYDMFEHPNTVAAFRADLERLAAGGLN